MTAPTETFTNERLLEMAVETRALRTVTRATSDALAIAREARIQAEGLVDHYGPRLLYVDKLKAADAVLVETEKVFRAALKAGEGPCDAYSLALDSEARRRGMTRGFLLELVEALFSKGRDLREARRAALRSGGATVDVKIDGGLRRARVFGLNHSMTNARHAIAARRGISPGPVVYDVRFLDETGGEGSGFTEDEFVDLPRSPLELVLVECVDCRRAFHAKALRQRKRGLVCKTCGLDDA